MAEVINTSKTDKGTVLIQIEVPIVEAQQLNFGLGNIVVFDKDFEKEEKPIKISSRGKEGATKYFKVPSRSKERIDIEADVNLKVLEREDDILFIYSVPKLKKFRSIKVKEAVNTHKCRKCGERFITKDPTLYYCGECVVNRYG